MGFKVATRRVMGRGGFTVAIPSGFVAPPPATPFVSDTFTAADGTLLQNHVDNLGNAWVKHGSATGDALIATNRLRNGAALGLYYNAAVPPSTDYEVLVDTAYLSTLGNPGVGVRVQSGAYTGYFLRTISSAFEILKIVAGSATSVVSKPTAVVTESLPMRIRVSGTTLSIIVAGAEVGRATDAAISAAGFVGYRDSTAVTNSTGIHLDNLVARQIVIKTPVITSSLFATNGVWTWFHDPRAIQAGRKLIVVWIDNAQAAHVQSRDLDTGSVAAFTLRSTGLLSGGTTVDDHANPSIIKLPDGRLRAFYCAHSGPTLWTRKTTNVNDITTWDAETTVPNRVNGTDYTYPNPMILSGESNRLYLFFRSFGTDTTNGGIPTLTYSDDAGTTWATPVPLIKELASGGQRPYVKYISNGVDRIHVWTTDGHPRDYTSGGGTNIYHFYIQGGNCYKSDGTLIQALPTDMASALTFSQVTKVYDHATAGKAWTWDVAVDGTGKPVGVFSVLPNSMNQRYYYARWTGSAWDVHKITDVGPTISLPQVSGVYEDEYSAGVVLDHNDPTVVFLSRAMDGTHEMQKWTTSDGGTTWSSTVITADTGLAVDIKNARPVAVRDRDSDCPQVVWHRGLFTSYTTHNADLHVYPPFVV